VTWRDHTIEYFRFNSSPRVGMALRALPTLQHYASSGRATWAPLLLINGICETVSALRRGIDRTARARHGTSSAVPSEMMKLGSRAENGAKVIGGLTVRERNT
jgi:hypothetical protein